MSSKEALRSIGSRMRADAHDIVEATLPARLLKLLEQLKRIEFKRRGGRHPRAQQRRSG